MKKIKVQSNTPIILIIICTIIFIALAEIMFYTSTRHNNEYPWIFISVLIFILPMLFIGVKNKNTYVSDMIINSSELIVVYKLKNKFFKQEVIKLNEIQSVQAELFTSIKDIGRGDIIKTKTLVRINTLNKTIEFVEESNPFFTNCPYSFMLRLLTISKYLPNFTYKVTGNGDCHTANIEDDIEHYSIYGKRLSIFERASKTGVNLVACFLLIFVGLSLSLFSFIYYKKLSNKYTSTTTKSSSTQEEYVSYINNGNSLYNQNNYLEANAMYDKALEMFDGDSLLYYYKARNYYHAEDYNNAVDAANKGISLLDNKSSQKNKLKLYIELADSYYKLKEYNKAKEAYNYIIENTKNNYSNLYLKRGICECYLGEKEEAFSDFDKHESIILMYFAEQETSARKAKKPTYTQKNLETLNKWREFCK